MTVINTTSDAIILIIINVGVFRIRWLIDIYSYSDTIIIIVMAIVHWQWYVYYTVARDTILLKWWSIQWWPFNGWWYIIQ